MADRRSIRVLTGAGSVGAKLMRFAWRTPPREIVLARLARAQARGMTYREYTAVLLDRGVHF